ncbi:MAG TPA: replication factor C large subunit [Candidatus Aenigmarchaeota archaeon]|nr:MAG: replication factor C large subunit [Candidatus Aenigmarchaeota archaeon]HDD46566.1 replication factor C large subunit [Candidatus Aenigmarchaeota archaeon]
MLWTEKYKPKTIEGIIGQKKQKEEILNFIRNFRPKVAMLVYGPPGVGKTLTIEVIASQEKLLLVSMNASDVRNKTEIERNLLEISKGKPLFYKGVIILIDEVDGIAGKDDKGAVGAIINIIKHSKYPVFLIANDPWKPKLRELRKYCKMVKFGKIDTRSIEKKLKEICKAEGIEVDEKVIKNLARWSQGDIRSAIIDLQTLGEGKKKIVERDLEILGYRERENEIFNVLFTIFHSGSIMASKRAIDSCDKDADEIFWWIENNITKEFSDAKKIAKAFDILSKADIFRSIVSKQQNWRFKLYMIDMIASISLIGKEEHHKYIKYEPPKKISMMALTKSKRGELEELYREIGKYVHASTAIVKKYYVPYLKYFVKEASS